MTVQDDYLTAGAWAARVLTKVETITSNSILFSNFNDY